jgi:hypothetical protein
VGDRDGPILHDSPWTRLASLYLAANSIFMPISFGVQDYQSRLPIQNVIQASSLQAMAVPVLALLQRYFMRGVFITRMEKRK